jgi:hypothetical protein
VAYAGISFRIPGIRTQELLLSGFPIPDTRDKKNNYQKISKYEEITLRLGKKFPDPT